MIARSSGDGLPFISEFFHSDGHSVVNWMVIQRSFNGQSVRHYNTNIWQVVKRGEKECLISGKLVLIGTNELIDQLIH